MAIEMKDLTQDTRTGFVTSGSSRSFRWWSRRGYLRSCP